MPHPAGARDADDGRAVEAELGGGALLAAEEGLDGDEPHEADGGEARRVQRIAARNVVRDVAARTVPWGDIIFEFSCKRS